MYRTKVGDLSIAGFELLPTFAAPHHTVILSKLEAVHLLAEALGRAEPNLYADGRKDGR